MTDGNDEPNYITLAGTLSYQEIRIQESNRNNTYNNFIYMWSKGLLFKLQRHLSKLLDDITKNYDRMITIL